jgi:hypothetical protein
MSTPARDRLLLKAFFMRKKDYVYNSGEVREQGMVFVG